MYCKQLVSNTLTNKKKKLNITTFQLKTVSPLQNVCKSIVNFRQITNYRDSRIDPFSKSIKNDQAKKKSMNPSRNAFNGSKCSLNLSLKNV